MATAPLRKCMSSVAGTSVIDSPIVRVATSSVPLVTRARTAFKWYFSIARLAAATTFSAPGPCLGVEPVLGDRGTARGAAGGLAGAEGAPLGPIFATTTTRQGQGCRSSTRTH